MPADEDPLYATFAAHATEFDAVHPVWFAVSSPTTVKALFSEPSKLVREHTTAGGKRTLLIPTIAAVDATGYNAVSKMLKDPALRAEHVQMIVDLVTQKGFDGIDLDYEHLPDSDRDAYSQFVAELAKPLHDRKKSLSLAVGGLAYGGTSVWDYTKLSQSADQLHIMGYDYHSMGSHPGPTAPLGWIQGVVAYVKKAAPDRTDKFILGLANYGLAGSESGTNGWFGSSKEVLDLVGDKYDAAPSHMASCSFTNGQTVASGRAPNGTISHGRVYFEDILSHEEKVVAAKQGGLGGITYWTIGGEPDRPGPRTFFEMVRSHFPK